MTQLLRKPSVVRSIFRKTCILWNFAFYKFLRILVFNLYKRIGQLRNSLLYHDIITMTQFFTKPAVRVAESGIYSGKLVICEISHFTNFPKILEIFQIVWFFSFLISCYLVHFFQYIFVYGFIYHILIVIMGFSRTSIVIFLKIHKYILLLFFGRFRPSWSVFIWDFPWILIWVREPLGENNFN